METTLFQADTRICTIAAPASCPHQDRFTANDGAEEVCFCSYDGEGACKQSKAVKLIIVE
jgi:hypothetical protein